MNAVMLSAVCTGRLYSPGNIPGTHFCYSLNQPQGHCAVGRVVSMNNSNDTKGNRTRNLPACSAVPQPTAPTSTPQISVHIQNIGDLPSSWSLFKILGNFYLRGNYSKYWRTSLFVVIIQNTGELPSSWSLFKILENFPLHDHYSR
jgi:hypothetical protein